MIDVNSDEYKEKDKINIAAYMSEQKTAWLEVYTQNPFAREPLVSAAKTELANRKAQGG